MVGDDALGELLRRLARMDYHFITPTPVTHQLYWERHGGSGARSLRDIFGWNLPFLPEQLGGDLLALLEAADAVAEESARLRTRLRVSSLGGHLYLHSSFPTDSEDAVFFGPDTYRFARFIEREGTGPVGRMLDLGTGCGAGGIHLKSLLPAAELVLSDVSPAALRLARINARAAGVAAEVVESDGVESLDGGFDLIIANPPFMADEAQRTYRHGGGTHGEERSLAWALGAAARLNSGGRLLLYTGSAITGGESLLVNRLDEALGGGAYALRCEEIDPDIFPEELDKAAYRDVERIAALGITIQRP